MRKYRKLILVQLLLAILMLTGCNGVLSSKDDDAVKTFADWTDNELFQNIPALYDEESRISEVADYGDETYMITINGTSLEQYESYLTILEEVGFEKYVDNGSEGLDGCVYTATYLKDKLTLTVSHMVKTNITYITASEKMQMSEHLFYKDEYVADNVEGASHTLHLLELHTYGDSYVIQMKNGNFIMIDGGIELDTRYLLDYLETLVPEGQKPCIEAWFITHGHPDHIGPFKYFMGDLKQAGRITVEGVYFTEPSQKVSSTYGTATGNVQIGTKALQTKDGERTPFYRPQTGQRYYFNDITIDIVHTQEQLLFEDYEHNFNDSSSWYMFTIDGQKFLDAGDASEGGISVVKRTYNQEYFDLDLLSVFHHGQNAFDSYVKYFSYKVAIYPTFIVGSQTANYQTEENQIIQDKALESMSWGDGTKVLTFPYQIGTVKSLPMRDWIYDPLRETPVPY